MKIRTDFVTNSSSSSFIVSLHAKLADGMEISFDSSHSYDGGGYAGSFMWFEITEKDIRHYHKVTQWVTVDEFDVPDEVHDAVLEKLSFLPGVVDLNEIIEAREIEDLIAAIKTPFLRYELFSDGKDEDELVKEIIENAILNFNQVVDAYDSIMTEHIKTIADLKDIEIEYSGDGFGELLMEREEILSKIFGKDDSYNIYSAIVNNSEEKAEEILKKMKCLKNVDEETIAGLISFVNECSDEWSNNWSVQLTLNSDGKLHYEIDYDCVKASEIKD